MKNQDFSFFLLSRGKARFGKKSYRVLKIKQLESVQTRSEFIGGGSNPAPVHFRSIRGLPDKLSVQGRCLSESMVFEKWKMVSARTDTTVLGVCGCPIFVGACQAQVKMS